MGFWTWVVRPTWPLWIVLGDTQKRNWHEKSKSEPRGGGIQCNPGSFAGRDPICDAKSHNLPVWILSSWATSCHFEAVSEAEFPPTSGGHNPNKKEFDIWYIQMGTWLDDSCDPSAQIQLSLDGKDRHLKPLASCVARISISGCLSHDQSPSFMVT